MSNPKRHHILKLSLIGLSAIVTLWFAYDEYPAQYFSLVSTVSGYLVEVTVLVDALLMSKDSDTN